MTAHIDALNAYRGDAVPAVQPWANSIDPQLKIRAQLFLGSRQTGSFDQFAPLIEQAPVELFPPVLEFARSSPEGLSVLREVVGDNASTTKLTNRAAILLNDLGDSEPIETLLQGSDDFDKDSAVWMEAAHWCDKPDRWIELLKRSVDTEVQYHTILILSSFPREELIGRQPAIDIAALVNSPNASIHSAGRLLACAPW